jgi:hypothetical protein
MSQSVCGHCDAPSILPKMAPVAAAWCRAPTRVPVKRRPGIQEAILFLPRTDGHRASIRECHMRPTCAIHDWREAAEDVGRPG